MSRPQTADALLKAVDKQARIGLSKITDEEYFALPYLSHSDLRKWVKQDEPRGRYLIVGSAVHCLALEGNKPFLERFHVEHRDYDLRTAEGKEGFSAVEAENRGKQILRAKEAAIVKGCVTALRQDTTAMRIIEADGENEMAAVGRFPGSNLHVKCKIDMIRKASLWDLKTTNLPGPEQFIDSVVKYGYDSQGAWYSDLYCQVSNEFKPMYFLCVSKQTFNVWTVEHTPLMYANGARWYRDCLALYERYEEAING